MKIELFNVGELFMIIVAKRAGGFGSGQSGLRVKRVTGQNGSFLKRVNRVAGQSGRGLSRVVSRVEFTRIFQTIFFFLEIDAIC